MQIRTATENDIETLAAFGAATFGLNFKHLYPPEDFKIFIQDKHSPDYYRAALADPKIGLLVADDGGEIAAYCKFGPNTLASDPPCSDALELSRIYVSPDYQSQGLGQILLAEIETYARRHGYPAIVLSVFSENPGAIRFYENHGFSKIGDTVFQVGKHEDHDFIFLKRLSA